MIIPRLDHSLSLFPRTVQINGVNSSTEPVFKMLTTRLFLKSLQASPTRAFTFFQEPAFNPEHPERVAGGPGRWSARGLAPFPQPCSTGLEMGMTLCHAEERVAHAAVGLSLQGLCPAAARRQGVTVARPVGGSVWATDVLPGSCVPPGTPYLSREDGGLLDSPGEGSLAAGVTTPCIQTGGRGVGGAPASPPTA